jgi:hypothetical protein
MTVTVTPTVELSNVPPRVRLNVSASAGETSTVVTRLDPDGVTRTVRTTDGADLPISGGTALVYDYEMPYGQTVNYSSEESPATVSADVTVDEDQVWLVHPGVPDRSLPITVQALDARQRKVQRGVYYPLGGKYAIVHTDGQRKSSEYTLSLYTATDDDRAALDELFDDAGVLLLNIPAGKGWGISWEYVAVGDVTESRPFRVASLPDRIWSLPVVVVDQPVGGTQSQRTWTDVVADYSTWSQVKAHYPTWAALLAGP